jgi:hypothetical protein
LLFGTDYEKREYVKGLMADTKQLALLKQGVRDWNAWRRENDSIKIILVGAKSAGPP